jgi:hypothetical protein
MQMPYGMYPPQFPQYPPMPYPMQVPMGGPSMPGLNPMGGQPPMFLTQPFMPPQTQTQDLNERDELGEQLYPKIEAYLDPE